ncbi:MAG: asparagine synthase (glutamine-hydrolyzing) [bacterium]
MCGIVGFSGKNEKMLHSMLGTIEHRGPDGEGMEVNNFFSIGMRRLAIIDPNGGWQPIYNKDKSVCIVFNGEIYNYQEVWKELQTLGYEFSTDHSDTETILHGYEEWGVYVLNKIKGMFAFAIWDSRIQKLFIARDRLGIKPLYYYNENGKFVFGSEIKALLVTNLIHREYDEETLMKFLMFRVHDSTEQTFFKGIKRLQPGHYMIVGENGIEGIKKYWNPTFNPNFKSEKTDDEYAKEFYDLYKSTIKRHIISDVPVGVSLSGGLDSSGVVSVMRELMLEGSDLHTSGKLFTFSALYPGKSIDESKYINEVERYVESTPEYAYPSVDKFWEEINEWIITQEEPTISSAPYAYYSVYRKASEFVKVMLSGNGGDELLAGYLPYFKSYATSAINQGEYIPLARELVKSFGIYGKYLGELVSSKLSSKSNLLSMKDFLLEEKKKYKYNYKSSDNLNERLFNDVTQYSTPNLLRYEDKNSMAFSIESRVPFLDSDLVEYIFNLPIDQKIKNGWTRYVYRNAMKGHMPELNRLRRSKIGFTNPEQGWMRDKGDIILSIFESDLFKSRGIYDTNAVVSMFKKWIINPDAIQGDGLIFWRILVTELWMRNYLD